MTHSSKCNSFQILIFIRIRISANSIFKPSFIHCIWSVIAIFLPFHIQLPCFLITGVKNLPAYSTFKKMRNSANHLNTIARYSASLPKLIANVPGPIAYIPLQRLEPSWRNELPLKSLLDPMVSCTCICFYRKYNIEKFKNYNWNLVITLYVLSLEVNKGFLSKFIQKVCWDVTKIFNSDIKCTLRAKVFYDAYMFTWIKILFNIFYSYKFNLKKISTLRDNFQWNKYKLKKIY